MPDEIRPKHPVPRIPDVASFIRRFGDHTACVLHLKETRWGANLERFVCPDCEHDRGWWLPTRQLVECRNCHHQTSPTAGTVFHGARVPLWKWFWAYTYPVSAGRFLDGWCRRVMRNRIEPMKKLARSLRAHRALLLNWFAARKQFSSGIVEGMNNKLQTTARKHYGFGTQEVLQVALYHTLADLPLPPITHRFC